MLQKFINLRSVSNQKIVGKMRSKLFICVLLVCNFLLMNAQKKENPQISMLYKNYLNLKNALAKDQPNAAAKAAQIFSQNTAKVEQKTYAEAKISVLKNAANALAKTSSIQKQREYFDIISQQMIALARKFQVSENYVFIQYCPMADAHWLSAEKTIVNPYYGAEMLSCGNLKSEIK